MESLLRTFRETLVFILHTLCRPAISIRTEKYEVSKLSACENVHIIFCSLLCYDVQNYRLRKYVAPHTARQVEHINGLLLRHTLKVEFSVNFPACGHVRIL